MKILDRSFTMKELLYSLDRKGICIERGETQSRITNSRYPTMFYAAALLEETAAKYYKRTKRGPQQFRQLDFLSIGSDKRKITLEDVIAPMYDHEKEYVYRFIGELKKKVRLSQSCKIWYYRTANFRYKNIPLFISGGENRMPSNWAWNCLPRIAPHMPICLRKSTDSPMRKNSKHFAGSISKYAKAATPTASKKRL